MSDLALVVQKSADNYLIASEVSTNYVEALTGGDPAKTALLCEAIMTGIRLKLQTVAPLEIREIDELRLALFYVRRSHGTDGHHRLRLLAKFATLLGLVLEGETTLTGIEPYG